jgi:hypothetical protein
MRMRWGAFAFLQAPVRQSTALPPPPQALARKAPRTILADVRTWPKWVSVASSSSSSCKENLDAFSWYLVRSLAKRARTLSSSDIFCADCENSIWENARGAPDLTTVKERREIGRSTCSATHHVVLAEAAVHKAVSLVLLLHLYKQCLLAQLDSMVARLEPVAHLAFDFAIEHLELAPITPTL